MADRFDQAVRRAARCAIDERLPRAIGTRFAHLRQPLVRVVGEEQIARAVDHAMRATAGIVEAVRCATALGMLLRQQEAAPVVVPSTRLRRAAAARLDRRDAQSVRNVIAVSRLGAALGLDDLQQPTA
ncbi:MAG: hypothetical protein AAF772_11705, partial [Acidobacteriota bacterium]